MFTGKKIQKILLIFPPTTFHKEGMKHCCLPLGVAYLASVLKNEFDVELLDASVEGYKNEVVVNRYLRRYGLSY